MLLNYTTTPSLNDFISIIKEVSLNHLMVKSFGFGPLYNMNADEELQTPYIWCEEGTSRITMGNSSHKTGLITFTLFCMDRIQKDQSNYIDTLSDTKYILDTIMTELDQHPLFISYGLSFDKNSDISIEPLNEHTDMDNNGHSCEFTWRYAIRYTPCNNPIKPIN